ncbi:MAG TPA: HEAT repeat domain-containing protein [Vicinamibacterales bacterium]|nr:HEAT repeat domain-containing protein [Vicinamibacterales bacterium]
MRRRNAAVVLVGGLSLVGLAGVRALPVVQAPNQAQMVTHTVAGVKFSTLPGFAIERANPPTKTDSYVVVTFDARGRPVVSKEQDHPRILLDTDNDGVYESEKIISDKVRNCQGLWFDGPTLYGACTDATPQPPAPAGAGAAGAQGGRQGGGRGGPPPPAGIYRLQDANGDDIADTFETIAMTPGGIQEHGPHAIRRSPDGGYTVISGNHATIEDARLDPDSLVLQDKDAQFLPYIPNFGRSIRQAVHSGVYRWDPTIDRFTVLFGGNRNAYDFAYNLLGEAFLFDSDMEWDINMPWYREVRTVHGIPGGNYGYRDGSGKYPAYYLDSLPPVRDVGRGSPVGVEFYQSYAYPPEFFDNFLEADWSRGRLLYTALTPAGATYTARSDRAEFVHGEPLNITDLEVGSDGLIYFTTGGRNTEGGFWRVRYTGTAPTQPERTGILAVVRQPQPLSSWGWAAIEQVKASMGAAFGNELERLARDGSADTMDRVRALYEMQRHGAAPGQALLSALASDRNADLRAAVVYVAGAQGELARQGAPPQAPIAAAALKDRSPLVRRRAAEALVRMGQSPEKPSLAPVSDIYALLNDTDRFVRWAGRLALERTARDQWKERAMAEANPLGSFESMIALVNTAKGDHLQPLVDKQLAAMKQTALPVEQKLRLFRAFQYTATQLETGLSPEQRQELHALVAPQFPAADERLTRELALMLAYAGQPGGIAEILAAMPKGNENQALQLHFLYALRVMKDGWTLEQKLQLADLLGRASTWRGGAQFVTFVGNMFDEVASLFTTDEEKQALAQRAPEFSPLSAEELEAIKARLAQAGGRGGGRGNLNNPLAARRAGRVVSRQEMLEEAVFQPQQQLDPVAGQQLFQQHCASCHRFGPLGTDVGVPALDLTSSALRTSKYAMLEAIMFPDRRVSPALETTVIDTVDGRTLTALVVREKPQLTLLTREGTVVELQPSAVKSRRSVKESLMTEAMADAMNQSQWRNLLAFLAGPAPVDSSSSR